MFSTVFQTNFSLYLCWIWYIVSDRIKFLFAFICKLTKTKNNNHYFCSNQSFTKTWKKTVQYIKFHTYMYTRYINRIMSRVRLRNIYLLKHTSITTFIQGEIYFRLYQQNNKKTYLSSSALLLCYMLSNCFFFIIECVTVTNINVPIIKSSRWSLKL